ncbi:Hypothetical protein CINCED_3A024415 [Cinara cedri]|uniref:Nuclear transport factor 2, eukaryote,NTF2-like domain n=1 Tax=Cinara cedri TaxID=506608 RepID=A0A5E4MIC2_9HEMI|nr:Hypothetical protein CINCED_3A024415 [Cinara cedri]
MADALTFTVNADRVGFDFAEHYYAVMRTTPEYANQFYDDFGEYRTIYEDGTAVVARNRLEMKEVLLRPKSAPELTVNSIISVPCGGSLDRLLVTVTGDCFTHVFVAEKRPERLLTYAIVASVTQHLSAGAAADRSTIARTFAAGDFCADTGADDTPTAGLKAQEHVRLSKNRATSYEPLPDTVTDNGQPDITDGNPLLRILNIPDPAEYTIENIPITDVKAKKQVRFAQNIAIYYEPLPDTVTHNAQTDITDENLVLEMVNDIFRHVPPPEIQTDYNPPSSNYAIENLPLSILTHIIFNTPPPKIESYSPKNANRNIQHNSTEKYSPVVIIKHEPNYTKVSTNREPVLSKTVSDNKTRGSKAKKQVRFARNIATYYEPLPDVVTDNGQPDITDENPLLRILNIPNPAEYTIHSESLPDTLTENIPIAGVKAKKQVRFAQNIATYYEPLVDTVNDIVQPDITDDNLMLEMLKDIFLHTPPPEIETSYKPSSPDYVTENMPLSILNHIFLNIPPPKIETFRELIPPNTATSNLNINLAEINPPRILTRISYHSKITTYPQPFQNTVRYQVPFSVFQPLRNVPMQIGPMITQPNFLFTVNGGAHQLWVNPYIQPRNFHLPPSVHRTNNVCIPTIRRG